MNWLQFAVAALCRVLRVSRCGFYAWQARPESARWVRDRQLLPAIEQVHAAGRETYGARKTWVALNQAGEILLTLSEEVEEVPLYEPSQQNACRPFRSANE